MNYGIILEQNIGEIHLHLDTSVQEMLDEHKVFIKKDVKPQQVPMQPGVILTNVDCPETPRSQ